MTAWQAVFVSLSKGVGISILVREGQDLACAADPLTAEEKVQFGQFRTRAWMTDSTEAMAAVRGRSEVIDRALSASSNAQVSYGFDFREGSSWGIKGRASDQGISFFATVSLVGATVTSLDITSDRPM